MGGQNVHIALNNLVTYELQLDILNATELYVTYYPGPEFTVIHTAGE